MQNWLNDSKKDGIGSLLELALVLGTRVLKDYCWEICDMFPPPPVI